MFFEDEKIPMSTLLQHMLMFYRYGGKQLYYFNTNDGQGEVDVNKLFEAKIDEPQLDDEVCESCTI
jgi:hypothetical protein